MRVNLPSLVSFLMIYRSSPNAATVERLACVSHCSSRRILYHHLQAKHGKGEKGLVTLADLDSIVIRPVVDAA